MAYIGRPLQVANLAVQSGTGDGSDTTPIATLDYATVTNGIAVYLDGVRQLAGTDFNVTAQTTLTFTTAPANSVGIDVYFLGLELSLPTPADATVTTAKIAANAVDETKLKDALVADFTEVVVTASDSILLGDATDSGNTKRDTIQGLLDLVDVAGTSEVHLRVSNDFGSTNTKIARWTTVQLNTGSDITYADSAANGATFTVNTAGTYFIGYTMNFGAASTFGLSLNSSELTTDLHSITVADAIMLAVAPAANFLGYVAITKRFAATDIIRCHSQGTSIGSNKANERFLMKRVG